MDNSVLGNRIRRIMVLVLAVVLAAAFFVPAAVHAEDKPKTVRVGWYESPFNKTDQFGRRSGYAYEYQRKIAAYTGWKYEYVEGSWSELLQMLKEGKIDLMSDVSYKEDRAGSMLYSSLPMGTESYYIFVSNENKEISSDDLSTLNGKKIGITKDSIQEDIFIDWAAAHGVEAEITELTTAEDESMKMVHDGKLDAFLTLDTYGDPKSTVPVCKIGSSDFFFVVNRDRSDLLTELDAALNRIQDENKYFNQQLTEKTLKTEGTEGYLTPSEKDWIEDHGTIRVGYQDNYLAFCASDEKGGLTGALKDYLDYASTGLENAKLDFEAVAYPTAADALEALKNGEVDCMFPANLNDYDGENLGVVMTSSLMTTEMDAVVRKSEQKEFVKKKDVVVAVNEGNTNYEMFLMDNYPGWRIAYFRDTPAGLDGVAAGDADCVIISNYRFSNISKQCEKLHLTTVYTGVDMDYYFAVREGDTELYSILNKVTDVVPESITNASLTYYSTEDVKVSVIDIIRDNLLLVLGVITLVFLTIIALLIRSLHLEKKSREEHQLAEELSRKVFVDELTSVRNKGAIVQYFNELQEKVDNDEKTEFALGMFDCDNLKQINDTYGHDKGDEYLKAASHLICLVFKHSPVFRTGGDEFAVVLLNEDYDNREDLMQVFRKAREDICETAENEWDKVNVSMGFAVYDPEKDHSVFDTMRRADKIMYENKRHRKLPDPGTGE